jgi:hypothetical protein
MRHRNSTDAVTAGGLALQRFLNWKEADEEDSWRRYCIIISDVRFRSNT